MTFARPLNAARDSASIRSSSSSGSYSGVMFTKRTQSNGDRKSRAAAVGFPCLSSKFATPFTSPRPAKIHSDFRGVAFDASRSIIAPFRSTRSACSNTENPFGATQFGSAPASRNSCTFSTDRAVNGLQSRIFNSACKFTPIESRYTRISLFNCVRRCPGLIEPSAALESVPPCSRSYGGGLSTTGCS